MATFSWTMLLLCIGAGILRVTSVGMLQVTSTSRTHGALAQGPQISGNKNISGLQ